MRPRRRLFHELRGNSPGENTGLVALSAGNVRHLTAMYKLATALKKPPVRSASRRIIEQCGQARFARRSLVVGEADGRLDHCQVCKKLIDAFAQEGPHKEVRHRRFEQRRLQCRSNIVPGCVG